MCLCGWEQGGSGKVIFIKYAYTHRHTQPLSFSVMKKLEGIQCICPAEIDAQYFLAKQKKKLFIKRKHF